LAVVFGRTAIILLGRGIREDGDERQAEKAREVGLRDRRAAGRGFDDRGVLPDPPVAQTVKDQGPRQAMLQATGRMARLVLEVEVHVFQAG
jgi:hypothetical protein